MFALSITAKPHRACVWRGLAYDFASGPLYAMTQGIGVAVGLQDHFEWRSVVASAAGAGVGQAVGQGLSSNAAFVKDFGKFGVGFVAGAAAGVTASLLNGGRVSIVQVASDAFGQAMAYSYANDVKKSSDGQQGAKLEEVGGGDGGAATSGGGTGNGGSANGSVASYWDTHPMLYASGDGMTQTIRTDAGPVTTSSYVDSSGSSESGNGNAGGGDGSKLEVRVGTKDGKSGTDPSFVESDESRQADAYAAAYRAAHPGATWEDIMQAYSDEQMAGQAPTNSGSPSSAPITITLTPTEAAIVQGTENTVKGAILGAAEISVLPIADTVQVGAKFVYTEMTGVPSDFSPLSSYGSQVKNQGAGFGTGLKNTAVNVFNVSPAGLVVNSGRSGYDLSTAIQNHNATAATESALGLGLGFTAAYGAGLNRSGVSSSIGESQAAIRTRVLANIEETRKGNANSNIDLFFAKSDQIASGYAADNWAGTTLKKGDVVYALRPGTSAYFTDLDTVRATQLNSASLTRALQVKAHDIYGYRPDLTGFRVTQDLFVPGAKTLANPWFGPGGGNQFFIQNAGKYLEPLSTINLTK